MLLMQYHNIWLNCQAAKTAIYNCLNLQDLENAPKVACLGYGASVAITAIRNHQNECER